MSGQQTPPPRPGGPPALTPAGRRLDPRSVIRKIFGKPAPDAGRGGPKRSCSAWTVVAAA